MKIDVRIVDTAPCRNENATSIAAGAQSACAVSNGQLRCWGANGSGQLGTGDLLLRTSATFAAQSDVLGVGRGAIHYCTVTASGAAKCQGSNLRGKLGDGTTTDSSVAVPVVGAALVTAISGGVGHTCLSRADGTVQCVGSHQFGQLGDGSTVSTGAQSLVLVTVQGLTPTLRARSVAAGAKHTCALRGDGTVACWGDDQGLGVLGTGVLAPVTTAPAPITVAGLDNITAISTSDSHTCALRADGTVACWGRIRRRKPAMAIKACRRRRYSCPAFPTPSPSSPAGRTPAR